jgi:hypothetical protein
MGKQIFGGAEVLGKSDRRNGIDPAGKLQYWYKNTEAGTVLLMTPCEVTGELIYATARTHVAEWDECYIIDEAGEPPCWEPWLSNETEEEEVSV